MCRSLRLRVCARSSSIAVAWVEEAEFIAGVCSLHPGPVCSPWLSSSSGAVAWASVIGSMFVECLGVRVAAGWMIMLALELLLHRTFCWWL
jgi:hypothetical protein